MNNASKIRKVSQFLQAICYLFLALASVTLLTMLYHMFFQPELLDIYVKRESVQMLNNIKQVSLIRGVPATVMFFLPAPLLMYTFWRLSLLLGEFKQGRYFTETNAQHLFIFSLSWILFHILPLPMIFLADFILTTGTGLEGEISIFVNGDEIPSFLTAVSFLVIAWILRESVKIANENAEFV